MDDCLVTAVSDIPVNSRHSIPPEEPPLIRHQTGGGAVDPEALIDYIGTVNVLITSERQWMLRVSGLDRYLIGFGSFVVTLTTL
jgi:hypothetical protein